MQAVEKLKHIGRRLVPKGSFKADLITLMTGTAAAQMITLAVSPLLTRLFRPEAFGILGIYLSLAAIANSAATLRYDQALMLPKDSESAAALFWNSILASGLISGISLLCCLLFHQAILRLVKAEELSYMIFLLPVSILFYGIFNSFLSWATRYKRFSQSSLSQVMRSVSIAVVHLFSGILKAGPAGLIAGVAAGDFFASLALGRSIVKKDREILKHSFKKKKLMGTASQFKDFPIYSTPQNLLNAVSQNIPLLLLAKFFGPGVAGLYVLGVRSIQIPMNFFSNALRQVFFQRGSEMYNRGGDTFDFFKKTVTKMLALATIPTLIIVIFGPRIFAFILGAEWYTAGEYARWLILWLAFRFANVPSVLFAQIYRRQRAVLIQDTFLLILRTLSILAGGIRNDPLLAVVLYSLAGVFFNVFVILWAGHFLRRDRQKREWAS